MAFPCEQESADETFDAYEWQDNFLDELPTLEVSSKQRVLNPWKLPPALSIT